MRLRVAESPVYRAYAERRAQMAAPSVWATLWAHWRSVATVLFVKAAENGLFYVFTTFYIVYITRVLHYPRTLALEAAAFGSIADVVTIFGAGALSDRIGRRPVTALGLLGAAAWTFMFFGVARSGRVGAVLIAAAIAGVCHGVVVGGMSAFFVELFPTAARYTGFSLGYQIATVFTGALAPVIGVALLDRYGSTLPVSLYAAAMTVPALLVLALSRETRGRDLS
jgi:MFS family permease